MAKFSPEKFQHLTERTDFLCCDEAHQFSSTTTLTTAQKFVNARWRTGTTGTLDDGKKIGKLNLIGLFSEPYQVITTKELMDQNSVVKLNINVCKIDYPTYIKE
jgi:superfamily II DNA or RNA helicase